MSEKLLPTVGSDPVNRLVVLPMGKSLEIAYRSIKVRFFRSLITTMSLVLAVSFLSFVRVSNDVANGLLATKDDGFRQMLIGSGYDLEPDDTSVGSSPKQRWIVILSLLVCVVGIVNAQLMAVTERFREFGIQLSMGMPQSKLALTVLIETVMIALIGIVIGNILGYIVNSYVAANPFEISGELAEMWREYGFLPVLTSTVRASSFLNTTLSIFGISILSSFYPLYRVHMLEPLKGIRYT